MALALALGQGQQEDGLKQKYDQAMKDVQTAKSSESLHIVAERFLALAEEAVTADLYEMAGKALVQAIRVARAAKSDHLAVRAQERQAAAKSAFAEYVKVKSALKALREKPDDPAANLAVGRYLSFTKGEWQFGLEFLAKGSDEKLKQVASLEASAASTPQDAETMRTLGDQWWPIHRDRALYWYKACWPKANPLQKDGLRGKFKEALFRAQSQKKPGPAAHWREGLGVSRDDTCSYDGRYSLRLDGQVGTYSGRFDCSEGQELTATAWVLSDRGVSGRILVRYLDPSDSQVLGTSTCGFGPEDTPFWTMLKVTTKVPAGVTRLDLLLETGPRSTKVWFDSVSLKSKGIEVKNGSFEE